MRLSRRSLVAGAATGYASICIGRYRADAAEFTYKLATSSAVEDPLTARALEAAARVKRDSSGRLEIQIYPNSVLGGDQEIIAQVRLGATEFFQSAHPGLSNTVPAAGLDNLPFIFSSHEDAWRAQDGPLGRHIRNEVMKAGLYAFEREWESSFRQMENNVRPLHTPDDLRGLKMRVVPGPVNVALMRTFGAIPTPVSIGGVYTALQTHLVDGADLPWNSLVFMKFFEVLKYGSLTNHIFTSLTIIGNMQAWQRLPSQLRDLVERHFSASALQARIDKRRDDSITLGQLRKMGFTYNEASHAAFRDGVRKAGLYTQWKTSFGDESWTVLEKTVGTLT